MGIPTQIKKVFSREIIFEAKVNGDTRGIRLGVTIMLALKAGANLTDANLTDANLISANLTRANLTDANLTDAKYLFKRMGVEPGNKYWKRFCGDLINNGYKFKVGINTLRGEEIFASDDRQPCSYPGFHFASRSWCAACFPERPLEALIRIPEDAQINEPWATDGKASADKIEILQVFDVETGEDVTDRYR